MSSSAQSVDDLFREFFDEQGVKIIATLPWREVRELQGEWRGHYAPGTNLSKKRHGLGWFVFSEGVTPSLQGRAALNEYKSFVATEIVVFAEGLWRQDGYVCSTDTNPDFTPLKGYDIYVVPPAMEWTMVFTHDWKLPVGPFFSRLDWLEHERNSIYHE